MSDFDVEHTMTRMLLLPLVVFFFLAAGCKPDGQTQPIGPTLVRIMPIRDTVVQLGIPLPTDVGTQAAGDTVVSLPPQEFTAIDGIRAHLTTRGLLRALFIEYTFRSNFDSMVTERTATLGTPHREPFRTGERVIWEDAETRFELVHDPERSAGPVYGILIDRTAKQ